MFACMECGRKFRTVKAAEKAASDGCPGCGGVDIDTYYMDEQQFKATQAAAGQPPLPRKVKRVLARSELSPATEPGSCPHGNPWGGPCGYCDGRGHPSIRAGDRVHVRAGRNVYVVDTTDGCLATLRDAEMPGAKHTVHINHLSLAE